MATDQHDLDVRHVDVAIVGLGSGGERLAGRLADAGWSVVGITDGRVGGECPFVACVPSKVHLADAAAGYPFAVSRSRRHDMVDRLDDDDHADDLVSRGVEVLRARARIAGPHTLALVSNAGERRVVADHVVIATGAAARTLDVADEGVDVWTSVDLMTAKEMPASIAVIGGGAIGCESAELLAGFGVEVVLAHRDDRVLEDEDPLVGERVSAALRNRDVAIELGFDTKRLEPRGERVRIHAADGRRHDVDRVLVAIGREPRRSDLGLDAIDLAPRDLGRVDGAGRVGGTDWLWSLGDVRGVASSTHAANRQADVIADVLLGHAPDTTFDPMVAPRTVYTHPPVYAVGCSGVEAAREGLRRVTVSHEDLARPAIDRTGPGAAVLFFDGDGRIRGFAGVGARVDEYGSVIALAMHLDGRVHDLAALMAPFPTHAEIITELGRRAMEALR